MVSCSQQWLVTPTAKPLERGGSRFQYGLNTFDMDPGTGGRHRRGAMRAAREIPPQTGPVGNVTAGSVPKMAISPAFLAAPKPVPTVAPIVTSTIVAKKPQTFTTIPQQNPFQSIFGQPQPLVAKANPPITPAQPQIASAPAAAQHAVRSSGSVYGKLTHRPSVGRSGPAAGSLPSVASYDKGYSPGTFLPSQVSGTGSRVDTSVKASLMDRKH